MNILDMYLLPVKYIGTFEICYKIYIFEFDKMVTSIGERDG